MPGRRRRRGCPPASLVLAEDEGLGGAVRVLHRVQLGQQRPQLALTHVWTRLPAIPAFPAGAPCRSSAPALARGAGGIVAILPPACISSSGGRCFEPGHDAGAEHTDTERGGGSGQMGECREGVPHVHVVHAEGEGGIVEGGGAC